MALGSGSSGAETKCKLNKTETEATLADESRRILQRFIEKQKYSELWTSPKPTTRKREAWELKTMVYGNISLEKVLEGFYPPPLDLASFANFCQKHHIEETLIFELLLHHIIQAKYLKFDDTLRTVLEILLSQFVLKGSEMQVNLDSRSREQIENALIKTRVKHSIDTQTLAKAQKLARRNLKSNTFRRFKSQMIEQKEFIEVQELSRWMCHGNSTRDRSFFTIPNPIPLVYFRFINFTTGVSVILGIAGAYLSWWCGILWLAFTSLCILLRLIGGPRLDPVSQVAVLSFDLCDTLPHKYRVDNFQRSSEALGICFVVPTLAFLLIDRTFTALVVGSVYVIICFLQCTLERSSFEILHLTLQYLTFLPPARLVIIGTVGGRDEQTTRSMLMDSSVFNRPWQSNKSALMRTLSGSPHSGILPSLNANATRPPLFILKGSPSGSIPRIESPLDIPSNITSDFKPADDSPAGFPSNRLNEIKVRSENSKDSKDSEATERTLSPIIVSNSQRVIPTDKKALSKVRDKLIKEMSDIKLGPQLLP